MLSNQQLVENQAERVDVGALGQRGAGCQLFGRHVAGRADQRALRSVLAQDGDAEVGDDRAAMVVDQDVGRLQVAVQHALGVGGGEAGAQLACDLEHTFRGETAHAAQQRRQVLAVHQFHGKEHDAGVFADVEHAADRRVRNLPGQADLVEDLRACGGTGRPDEFQRNRGLEHEVVGAPHVAHAAAPQPRNHAVTSRRRRHRD